MSLGLILGLAALVSLGALTRLKDINRGRK
jgi:hypothetical protein